MLQITRPDIELCDENNQEFINIKGQTLQLEHSLVSLSKWEAKWCKPFLHATNLTREEELDYIKCMTLNPNIDPIVYDILTDNNIEEIKNYINSPMTATFFSNKEKGKNSREIITSELIYYWMVALNIPFECQKWHLNRLITLIRVCEAKNQPPKKRSKREIINDYAALNEARKKQLNTKG